MKEVRTGIASYTEEQWRLLKKRAVDAARMDRTYADWEKNRDEALAMLRKQGYTPVLIPMDVAEIEAWCNARGKRNTGKNRALICSEKLRRMLG